MDLNTNSYTTIKVKLINSILLLAAVFISSCLEKIDIDLRSTIPHIVAEGQIEENSVAWVKLSYTTDYFNSTDTVFIEDAFVYLIDDIGQMDTLTYSTGGIYLGNFIRGRIGRIYTIFIIGDGFSFSAQTYLPSPAIVYSLSFNELDFNRLGSSGKEYVATLKFKNDPLDENFFMLKFWKNDTLNQETYTIFKDTYYISQDTVIYTSFRNLFSQGDRVTARLYSIDKNTFYYYDQLNDLLETGVGGASTPYNPRSNFGPEVMGYFFAYSYTSLSSWIPD